MKKIVAILKLTSDFSRIIRATGYRQGHLENDAEHSFQLAMVCWSTNHQYQLKLRDELILKYALVHDLVEVYAGDTDAHGDKVKIAAKKDNEREALERLQKEYAEYPEILEVIENYERKEDVESQLVYVIDKFIPDILVSESKSNYYIERKVTFEKWKAWLYGKIDYDLLDPKIKKIFDESVYEVVMIYSHIFYKK